MFVFRLGCRDRDGHGLDDLAAHHFGHQMIAYKDLCGSGANKRGFDEVPPQEACAYAAEDADMTLRLWQLLNRASPKSIKRGFMNGLNAL